jgi:hypothetical protein
MHLPRASRDQLIGSEADLRTHKIELEMQAEKLRLAKLAADESRVKYLDLYEFAQLSYLTINNEGLISEVNLTGATFLGVERSKLEMPRFSKFIADQDSDKWYRYFADVLKQEGKQACTFSLIKTAAKQAPLGEVMVENNLPAGAEVFADPLIVKVFYNLIDNAVRHGGKITTIWFSALEREGDHAIVCEDDGVGIQLDEKEHIFERGYGKNTGMGLFLSREIIDITGISIRETGQPGKGARFEMMVPEGIFQHRTPGDPP